MDVPVTLSDLGQLASERLDPDWREYFVGGAGDESTLRENVTAFQAYRLQQRVLCGIESVSTTASVLGHELAWPLVAAPVAYQRMAHEDGEEGIARAVSAVGAALCLSTFSTASTADVAAAAPDACRFLQVYVFRDRGITDELIARALDDGFTAVFLTVDLPVLGSRDRERRINWTFPDSELPAVQYALARGLLEGEGIGILDSTLDWAYLEQLCTTLPVPVVVKGVLEPDDALLAAEHGAAGVVVSNHGGRQLDRAVPPIEALPAIVERVGDRVEVLLDSGVRRGSDIAIAVALGACAVLSGTVPLLGLAARGTAGAQTALELLREELEVALHLIGCRTVTELGPQHVSRRVA